MGDTPSALRSSDVAVLGDKQLGLSGFPRVPFLPTDWGHGAGMLASHYRLPAAT
jgi:hypothetical protein